MSKKKSGHKRNRAKESHGERIDPHRQRESAKYDKPIASREFITSTLREAAGPVDFEALAEKLDLIDDDEGMEGLRRRVGAMIRDGQLIQNRRRGLVPVDADNLLAGRITAHPDGFGFVIVEDSDKDIYLNGKQMRQVLHGDKVVVSVTGIDRRGRREGRIVDVVERANKSLVGRLSIDMGTVVVLPDNKRIHQDLLIAPGELAGAHDGDMVVAEIVEQPTRRHQPVGKIIEVLGQHLRPGMEIDVALHSHGIPVQWPDEVLEQAAAFSTTVDSSDAAGRKDVRAVPMVTIDGIDARDFDDAVWCEPLESGWRLLVAIADVAHYVSLGSALDNEAVDRGTSVYFPGRVVPMLPEVLSNGLCSLNPHVDRLCMICELTLDAHGEVKKTRFHNGILQSHARLTYDEVNEMLTDSTSALRKKHAALLPVIEELHRLYKTLASKRGERGAIEFDSNETHIVFDDDKKIKEIVPIERNDAHKLIEECMILANIQAAAFLEEKEIPALYRVHSGPKTEKLDDLRAFLALRSLSLGGGNSPSAQDYAVLAEAIADRPDRSVIQTIMLRSMQQAVYQPKNEGHFGLALEQYAHFTSPIRRYPDLLVHRALKYAIERGKSSKYHYSKDAMAALGESCSRTERRAEEASRDVVSWLKCEYMQEHVGDTFDGVISAVTSFGLFVELIGIHVEGLIHVTNLARDYYKFDQAAQAMIGERTGKQYRLGDSIKVQIAAVNLEERKIDFAEIEQPGVSKRAADSESGRNKDKRKDKKQRSKEPETAVTPTLGDMGKQEKSLSAEKRRQLKRKRKQKRRDKKRSDRLAAKRDQAVVSTSPEAPTSSVVNVDAEKTAARKVATNGIASKKTSAKKVATKKAAAKKIAARKVTAKKIVTKKVTAKKIVTKKVATKKVNAKIASSNTSRKKDTLKKLSARTATAKKIITRKTAAKKPASKKAIAKTASKKTMASKAIAKKATAKKATGKKAAGGKSFARKPAVKKSASKKAASGQSITRRISTEAASGRKKAASGEQLKKKKLPGKATSASSRKKKANSTEKSASKKKRTSKKP